MKLGRLRAIFASRPPSVILDNKSCLTANDFGDGSRVLSFAFVCHPRLDRGSRVFVSPSLCKENDTGSPKFTNEVQHLVKVLPWDATTHNSPLTTAVMARLHTRHSIRQIAATLDRAPSTVARELNRNGSTTQGYQPGYADQQARARRWQGSKLDRDSTLRATVLAQLQHGWSPQLLGSSTDRSSHETLPLHLCADGPQNRVRLSAPGQSQTRAPLGAQPGVLYRSSVADRRGLGGHLMLFRICLDPP